jgi:hypothetical protein
MFDLCALNEMCFNALVSRGASSINSFAWSPASRPESFAFASDTQNRSPFVVTSSFVPAALRALTGQQVPQRCCVLAQAARPHTQSLPLYLGSACHLKKKLMLLGLQSCIPELRIR